MQNRAIKTQNVTLRAHQGSITGDLAVPAGAQGLIVFAHGSGSSRFSPRNRYVAEMLNAGGFGAFLLDLLTPQEAAVDELSAEYRFDIELLAERIGVAIDWLKTEPELGRLPIGLFGASTGSAAALIAAAEYPRVVLAVVSRGGRPDLAVDALRAVEAPTLLIVGGDDDVVLELNRQALQELICPRRLEIVPGAGHLFEEPGTLDHVVRVSLDWYQQYLVATPKRAAS